MTKDTEPNIGFVGLGHMGGNMAARFLAAGYPVYGEERNREHADELVHAGLQWRDTPREVAEAADIVFTSVPDDGVLEAVASGPDGILAGLAAGKIWVDMSTVSPRASRELAERVHARGATMLDAPVSGASPRCKRERSRSWSAETRHAYARVEPLLRELGTPTHIGENGQGLVAQARDQHQPRRADARVRRGPRSGRARRYRPQARRRRDDGEPDRLADAEGARRRSSSTCPNEAWFDVGLMQKDIALALDTARQLRRPAAVCRAADELLTMARALGLRAARPGGALRGARPRGGRPAVTAPQ